MFKYELITGENDSPESFGLAGALTFIKILQNFSRRPFSTWPTGTTPLPVNKALRGLKKLVPPFTYCGLDQYPVEFDDPRSYPLEVKRELLDPLGLPLDKNLIFDGMAKDTTIECDRMNSIIKAMGGFDIAVMGLGKKPDIHIAFNKVGTPFDAQAHYTKLPLEVCTENEKVTASIGGTPTHAYTVGTGQLVEAKCGLLFANKAEETVAALHGPITTDVPASALQLRTGRTIVVATHEVAEALRLAA